MKKTIVVFLFGFVIGIIVSYIIGFFSLYELFAAFLDKPFFQTHGIWIMGAAFMFFALTTMLDAYDRMHERMESRYNIIESLKEWGKVLAEESANIALHKVLYNNRFNKKKGD